MRSSRAVHAISGSVCMGQLHWLEARFFFLYEQANARRSLIPFFF